MKSVRIGFIGLGGICRQRHVPGLQHIDGVELTAVCNRSRESGEAAAQEFDVPHVETDWRALITRDDVDAVFIGTWPYMHKEMTLAALDAGKHVFCQARMAMNRAEAEEMYAKSQTCDRVTMLCPVPFGLSIDKTMLRLQKEGELGNVRLVRVQSFTDLFADPDAVATWRKDHRLSGLNMHTMGMYFEVMHRWFGWTRNVSAQSQIFTPVRKDTDGNELTIEIPDQVLISADTESGVPVQYTYSTVVGHGVDRIEIYGSKMTLRYDVFADKLYEVGEGESLTPVEIRPEDAYDVKQWRVEEDFIRAIREGTSVYPDFHDGVQYMRAAQAVHDSIEQGKTITA